MDGGYVKVSRSLARNWLIQHPNALAVFVLLLVEAQWKARKYSTSDGFVNLLPGQWVTAIRPLAKRLRMSEMKIRHALKLLVEAETISIETTHRFSIITLKNWEQYQTQEKEQHSLNTVSTQSQHKNKKVSIKEEEPTPQAAWNPISVLLDVFKKNGVEITQRHPRQLAILSALHKKIEEPEFRKVAEAYCQDVFLRQNGLSINGFLNNFDRLRNREQAPKRIKRLSI